MSHFPLVACGIGLNSCEIPFAESGWLGTAVQKKLTRAIQILDARPGIIAFEKAQRRFQQIAIADVAARNILISPPQQHRRPVSLLQRTVVLDRCSHSPDIFAGRQRFRAVQLGNGILHSPVLAGTGGDSSGPGINLSGVDVPAGLVGLAPMKARTFQAQLAVCDSQGDHIGCNVSGVLKMVPQRRDGVLRRRGPMGIRHRPHRRVAHGSNVKR